MKGLFKENGAVTVVEATFVFPIMIFVLFFLVFYGNSAYVKSNIDAVVTNYTIEAAAEISDPLLSNVKSSDSVSTSYTDGKPYRYFGNSNGNGVVSKYKTKITNDAKFSGFFGNMTPKSVQCKGKYNNYFLYQTVSYEVTYNIQVPIRFLFSDKPPVLMKFVSFDEEVVNDTSELILNTNMVIDYVERTKLSEKISSMTQKIKEFF